MEAEAVIALVVGVPIVLFVPALVWSADVAGLYRIVRDRVRKGLRALAQKAAGGTAKAE